jgi:hypothetical protein
VGFAAGFTTRKIRPCQRQVVQNAAAMPAIAVSCNPPHGKPAAARAAEKNKPLISSNFPRGRLHWHKSRDKFAMFAPVILFPIFCSLLCLIVCLDGREPSGSAAAPEMNLKLFSGKISLRNPPARERSETLTIRAGLARGIVS